MMEEMLTATTLREKLLRSDEGFEAQLQDIWTEVRALRAEVMRLQDQVFQLQHPEDRELPCPL